jgi:hypothetical protein
MSDLSPDAQRLLRDARAFDEPSAADAQRVHASVLAKVGIAVGAGAGVTAATTSIAASPAAALAVTAMKLGAAIVVAGGLATASYVALRPPSSKPRPALVAVVEAPKAPLPVPEAPGPEAQAPSSVNDIAPRIVEAQPSHAKGGRSRRGGPAPVDQAERAPRATPPDLEGEARLLEQADADLRRGDAQAALGRLAEHAAQYPSGALREEREGIRVVALCRAGREAEGKAAADRFLARSPRSTLAARIRAACGD